MICVKAPQITYKKRLSAWEVRELLRERADSTQVAFHIFQNQETPLRQEESLNLFFGLDGTSEIYIETGRYEVSMGGILAVSPRKLYRVSTLKSSVIVLQIPLKLRKAGGEKDGRVYEYHCYIRDDKQIQPEFHELRVRYAEVFYEYLQNRHTVSESVQGALMQLLRLLTEHYSTSREVRGDRGNGRLRSRREEAEERTAALLQYIDAHWDEDLSLSSLAEEMHFSVSYLSRFFQKETTMGFAAYLRKVRMIHARRMLAQGDLSITQIAYDCGFRNPSVFIEAFKQEYEVTPGQFRQKLVESDTIQAGTRTIRDSRSNLSALLAYLPEKETDEIAVRQETVEVDCSEWTAEETGQKEKGILRERILNIGYARDGLEAGVQAQIRRAQEEIGFRYFRCHGIFDEDMHIYGEEADGTPFFSFAYADMLFDFVTEQGLIPFVELGFMPAQIAREQTRIFDRFSVISGCAQPEKWKALIRAFLEHLSERYGLESLRTWRFTTISLSYVRIGCLTLEDFQQLYEMTYRIVKDFDPALRFGGTGCFPDLTGNREIGLPWFLHFAAGHRCLPDFHTIQWYPCIQTDDTLFMEYTLNQHSAPAILSTNPDYLRDKLDELDDLFRQYQVDGQEIFLEECNSTLWQRDLSGDTCYKAVWLAKNMVISAGRAVFGYWLLTDLIEERAHLRSVFHGGYGLFTYNGIPKAGYHAMRLIAQLGTWLVAEGKGWILTRKESALQLLIYNYTHYSDINCFRYKRLETPEDAYSVFSPGEKMQLRFLLKGIIGDRAETSGTTGSSGGLSTSGSSNSSETAPKCRVTRTLLNREHGSSFDLWLRLQAPPYPSKEETDYMKTQTAPLSLMEIRNAADPLVLDVSLMPLEMELIIIECI